MPVTEAGEVSHHLLSFWAVSDDMGHHSGLRPQSPRKQLQARLLEVPQVKTERPSHQPVTALAAEGGWEEWRFWGMKGSSG